jgi:hypothetical protein
MRNKYTYGKLLRFKEILSDPATPSPISGLQISEMLNTGRKSDKRNGRNWSYTMGHVLQISPARLRVIVAGLGWSVTTSTRPYSAGGGTWFTRQGGFSG